MSEILERLREENRANVARGVELLDRIEPAWRGRIDLARLDANSYHSCVLCQVFGSWGVGVQTVRAALPPGRVELTSLGFMPEEAEGPSTSAKAKSFNAVWREALAGKGGVTDADVG